MRQQNRDVGAERGQEGADSGQRRVLREEKRKGVYETVEVDDSGE
jgi:hypothetical protein